MAQDSWIRIWVQICNAFSHHKSHFMQYPAKIWQTKIDHMKENMNC